MPENIDTPPQAHAATSPSATVQGSLGKELGVIFVVRTVLNTAHRIVYPFLPSIARGLGISVAAAGGLVTLRMVAALAAPLFGPVADRRGRRPTMEFALLLFVLANLLLVSTSALAAGAFVAAAGAFLLFGLAKVLYDPAVHAYLGDTVPYQKRGRAVGLVELSWSSAWLIGVPAAGFLIEHLGWRAPWAVLAVLALLGLGLTHVLLPRVKRTHHPNEEGRWIALLASSWRHLLRRRSVVVLLLTSMLLTMALEIPFIVYGAWLETSFGLGLSTLGLASIVVGLAEATAELGTTVLTDRLGKRRSVLAGLSGLAASLLLLPLLAGSGVVAALTGVVLVMLFFEFAIVSLLPLVTQLVPEKRASLLSLNVTAFGLGRIAGAAAGGLLWQWGSEGIAVNATTGAICALAAAGLMGWGMVEIVD